VTGTSTTQAMDRVYGTHPYGAFPWDRRRFSRATVRVIAAVLRPDTAVVDVGCGSGFWLGVLRETQPDARVSGMDRSTAAVRHVRSAGVPCVQGDAQALPYRSGSVDLVFCSGVVHHLPDPERALREAARVLRPGGALLLEVYNAWHPWFWLGHRAAAPIRFCYWRGAGWLLLPLRWLAALALQPPSLFTCGRLLDRNTLDVLVLDQILNPMAALFTAARLRRLGAAAGLSVERGWTKQGGLLRGALFRKPG
jgi:SAM-dependent methyltransferase